MGQNSTICHTEDTAETGKKVSDCCAPAHINKQLAKGLQGKLTALSLFLLIAYIFGTCKCKRSLCQFTSCHTGVQGDTLKVVSNKNLFNPPSVLNKKSGNSGPLVTRKAGRDSKSSRYNCTGS